MITCLYAALHWYPTLCGMYDANKPHLSPHPCSFATVTNRSISSSAQSPCHASSPGALCL